MNLETRIEAFIRLGSHMTEAIAQNLDRAAENNPWFTPAEIHRATTNLAALLTRKNLRRWLQPYQPLEPIDPREILVISAGNIPMVGFHDFLSVLISGNHYTGKLSSKDNILIPILAEELVRIEPSFSNRITFTENPVTPDAVIATGGSNTSRYFARDFTSIPIIIRKNRTSVAILDGSETDRDYTGLAADILEFYGLGCRNVSHAFLPFHVSVDRLAEALDRSSSISPNRMYADNIDYQIACLKLARIQFTKTSNILLTENSALFSPIGVLNYSHYGSAEGLKTFLDLNATNIQCLVGHQLTPFGFAHRPELWDYADNIDTLSFLKSLHS